MNAKIFQRIVFSLALLFTGHFAIGQCSATLNGGGGGSFCPGEVISVAVDFTGDGPWELVYEIDGTVQPTVNTSDNPYVIEVEAPGGTITLISVSTPTCPSGTVSGSETVSFSPPIFISCDGVVMSICGSTIIDCPVTGGVPPYLFEWSNGSTDPSPEIFTSGIYEVTVTDIMGCFAVGILTVETVDIPCGVSVSGELGCLNPTITLDAGCVPNIPLSFVWTDEFGTTLSSEPFVTVNVEGTYTVQVLDLVTGCVYTESVAVEAGTEDCALLMGQVIVDDDDDCLADPGEEGLGGWLVKAENTATGDEFFAMTDTLGNYSISLLPGDFLVDVVNPAPALWLPCESAVPITLDDVDDVETVNFHIGKLIDCPLMQVDIGTPFLRRCFQNNFSVSYCNMGTVTAENATVEVTLDPLLLFQSATVPWTGPVGDVYTFDIGDVEPGDCGSFTITVEVSCDALLEQTLCAEAHVFPDTLCEPIIPGWSGASLQLSSFCDGDSLYFTITNVGTGTMQAPLIYIVIEDGVMMMEETDGPPLGPGESHVFAVPANGSTYILDVPQVENHPGSSAPLLAIEGCGTNGSGTFSLGFVSQFPENDGDPFVSIDCREVIGAFDPNDKRGFPLGFGDEHFIEPGQSLDYHIRFQNTGTDTAFNVRIEDVISEKLDLATFRPGASSHYYEVKFREDTVVFLFPDIMLPDSNVNEPLSHGFVKFNIEQNPANELGDIIENTADIYFDFNEAVVTNTTLHRLGEEFVPSSVFESNFPGVEITAQPNPTSGETFFRLSGNLPQGEITLSLFSPTGQLVGTEVFLSPAGKVDVSALPDGLYFFQLKMKEGVIGNGKILKR